MGRQRCEGNREWGEGTVEEFQYEQSPGRYPGQLQTCRLGTQAGRLELRYLRSPGSKLVQIPISQMFMLGCGHQDMHRVWLIVFSESGEYNW